MKSFIEKQEHGALKINLNDGTTEIGSIADSFLVHNSCVNRKYFYHLKVIDEPKYDLADNQKIRNWIIKHCPEYDFCNSELTDICDFPPCKPNGEYSCKEQLNLLIDAMNREYKRLYPNEFVQENSSAISFLKSC